MPKVDKLKNLTENNKKKVSNKVLFYHFSIPLKNALNIKFRDVIYRHHQGDIYNSVYT